MAAPLIKAVLTVGAVGVTGASGFGVYKQFFSAPSLSVREAILNSSSYSNKLHKFLDLKDSKWSGIQEEYGKLDASNTLLVKREDLPSWCVSEISKDYSKTENTKFDFILRWCYVNTNSFEEQMKALNRELVGPKEGESPEDANAWKGAWNSKYKDKKTDLSWKITDSSNDGHLNGNVDTDGGSALRAWCSSKLSTFMYVKGVEDTFRKFKEFCFKG